MKDKADVAADQGGDNSRRSFADVKRLSRFTSNISGPSSSAAKHFLSNLTGILDSLF